MKICHIICRQGTQSSLLPDRSVPTCRAGRLITQACTSFCLPRILLKFVGWLESHVHTSLCGCTVHAGCCCYYSITGKELLVTNLWTHLRRHAKKQAGPGMLKYITQQARLQCQGCTHRLWCEATKTCQTALSAFRVAKNLPIARKGYAVFWHRHNGLPAAA